MTVVVTTGEEVCNDHDQESGDLDHITNEDDIPEDCEEEKMEAILNLKVNRKDSDVAGLFSVADEFPAVDNPKNVYPNVAE